MPVRVAIGVGAAAAAGGATWLMSNHLTRSSESTLRDAVDFGPYAYDRTPLASWEQASGMNKLLTTRTIAGVAGGVAALAIAGASILKAPSQGLKLAGLGVGAALGAVSGGLLASSLTMRPDVETRLGRSASQIADELFEVSEIGAPDSVIDLNNAEAPPAEVDFTSGLLTSRIVDHGDKFGAYVDTSRDGLVDRQELELAVGTFDTNRDGVVGLSEVPRMIETLGLDNRTR